jgi:hypothetical protein
MFESNCSLITEWTTLVAAHMECPEELRDSGRRLRDQQRTCRSCRESRHVAFTNPPTMSLVTQTSARGDRRRRRSRRREAAHTTPQDADDTEGDDVVPAHAARTFKDVEVAAQAAFESAATAAAAAKAAIELSRAGSGGYDRYRRTPGRAHAESPTMRRCTDARIWSGAGRFQSGQTEDFSCSARAIWQQRIFLCVFRRMLRIRRDLLRGLTGSSRWRLQCTLVRWRTLVSWQL